MPGLAGFTHHRNQKNSVQKRLNRMRASIAHFDFHHQDHLFVNQCLAGTRVHLNIRQKEPQPEKRSGIYLWLDGELNNQDDLRKQYQIPKGTDSGLLSWLYKTQKDFSFLKQIDGIYTAIIYDANEQQVHLLSDRYGIRQLYWTTHQGELVWSSELKTLLAMPDFTPEIDLQALEDFFQVGYLCGDRTWFKGVNTLQSGTVLSWDLTKKDVSQKQYWDWEKIRPLTATIDEDLLVDNLGQLFIKAIRRRCDQDIPTGLTLSGGLDSRAILAALPNDEYPVHAVSFGKKGADDLRIAKMAAKIKKVQHHQVEINDNNWLDSRLNAIWWTDGHLNLLHMHGIESLPLMRKLFKIHLSGFLGDVVMGGSYYDEPGSDEIRLIKNRGRRFIGSGIKLEELYLAARLPFFDNQLINFVMSLPRGLREHSYIYNKMLLKYFPEFYRSIPWQKTELPISYPRLFTKITRLKRRLKKKLLQLTSPLNLNIQDTYDYTDYPRWIRVDPGRSLFNKLLTNPQALYPRYLSQDKVIDKWEKHLRGENHADWLGRVVTFEVWLRQVFLGQYRPGK